MKLLNLLLIVTIVIATILFPSCDDSVKPEKNQPPVIESISSSPFTPSTNRIPGGTSVQVSVIATDPDKNKLSYTWQADGGVFDGEINKAKLKWIAPKNDLQKDYTIKGTVSDGALTAQGEITIYVSKTTAPTVITHKITNITESSAIGGGEVTDDGGSEVEVRGVVWSKAPQPRLELSEGYTDDGIGLGVYTSYV